MQRILMFLKKRTYEQPKLLLPSFMFVWLLGGVIYCTCTLPTFCRIFNFLLAGMLVFGWFLFVGYVVFTHYNPIQDFISRLKNAHSLFYLRLLHVATFCLCCVLASRNMFDQYDFSILHDGELDPFAETVDYIQVLLPAPYKDSIQLACDSLSVLSELSTELTRLSEIYGKDAPVEVASDFIAESVEKMLPVKDSIDIATRNTKLFTICLVLDDILYRIINLLLKRRYKRTLQNSIPNGEIIHEAG